MINIKIPLLGTDTTVSRHVVVGVANDIKSIFSLDKDMHTALASFIEHYSDPDANIGDGAKNNFLPTLNKKYDMNITFEETVDEDAIINTDINNPNVVPVFHDSELDLIIKPIYVQSKITLVIKYFTKSKFQADSILNDLKIKAAENAEMTLHDLEYYFYLSKGISKLLIDVLERKNGILPDDKKIELEDYLIAHTGKRLNAANSYIGLASKTDLIIKEKQRQVVGYFDMDIVNTTKDRNDERNGWEVNLNYTVTYNKPIYTFIRYPIIIYNSLLPKEYVQRLNVSADKVDIDDHLIGYSDVYKMVRTEYLINKWYRNWHYVSIPYYDLHKLPQVHPYMLRLFVVLLQISNDDKRTLFNLTEIPGYKLADDVVNYIKEQGNNIIRQPYSSVFQLVLYEGNGIVNPIDIEIDKDLNIKTNKDLDMTKTYRMSFNVVTDWTLLNANIRKKAENYPNIRNRVFEFLAIDRNNFRFTDDSMISVPQPALINYYNGINVTHIEAFLNEEIYEDSEKMKTMFDTKG